MHIGSVRNTILYLLLLVFSVLTLVATNSGASLWVLLFLLVLAIACGVHALLTARFMEVDFSIERSHAEGSPFNLVIKLSAPMFVLPTRVEIDAVFINQLFGIETSNTFVLRSTGTGGQTFVYPYPEFGCGKVDVRVKRISFYDTIGLARVDQLKDFKSSLLVYPQAVSMKLVFDRSPQAAYSGMTFDRFKRGVDKSEVLDLRPYVDGDDPRDVHWKLSAKLGELTVREASRPTDYNICVLLGLGRRSAKQLEPDDGAEGRSLGRVLPVKTLDRALALFGSTSLEMVHGSVGHEVIMVDGSHLRFHTVDSQSSWGFMLDTALSLLLPETPEQAIDMFALDPNCAHFTKVVYVTTEIDEEGLRRLSERCDVTVFLIGEVATSQYESIENCDIISLATSQLEGRVETLSV